MVGTGPIYPENVTKRENAILAEIDTNIHYYTKQATRARVADRLLKVTTLVGSIFSPLFVISATNTAANFSVFGMSAALMGKIALVLTIVVALSEGLSQIFRPSDRWKGCSLARFALIAAREEFQGKRVRLGQDTMARLDAADELNARVAAIGKSELLDFFDRLMGGKQNDGKPQTP